VTQMENQGHFFFRPRPWNKSCLGQCTANGYVNYFYFYMTLHIIWASFSHEESSKVGNFIYLFI